MFTYIYMYYIHVKYKGVQIITKFHHSLINQSKCIQYVYCKYKMYIVFVYCKSARTYVQHVQLTIA